MLEVDTIHTADKMPNVDNNIILSFVYVCHCRCSFVVSGLVLHWGFGVRTGPGGVESKFHV